MGKNYKVKTLLILICCMIALGSISLSATSLRLKNDTKNLIVAEILAADGTPIGEEMIKPFDTDIWSYENSMRGKQVLNRSVTPLTVVWKTEKGDFYSACKGLVSGAMVTPTQCRAGQ